DRLAVLRLHHISGIHRGSRRHVRGGADDSDDIRLGLDLPQSFHRPEYARAAAHVELHELHSLGGLDRDATTVEAQAFANEHDWLGVWLSALVLESDDLGILRS